MAAASKVNAGLLAVLLPGAAIIFFSNLDSSHQDQYKWLILRNVILAGAISLLTFRVLQPYAFSAPGFLTQSPLVALQGGPSGITTLYRLGAKSEMVGQPKGVERFKRRRFNFSAGNPMGTPADLFRLAESHHLGVGVTAGDPRLVRIHLDGDPHLKGHMETIFAVVGLDIDLFSMAIHQLHPQHALPDAGLPDPGDYRSLDDLLDLEGGKTKRS